MQDILKKLAIQLLMGQLKNPALRDQLHTAVNAQVNALLASEATALTDNANPFLGFIGVMLKDPATVAQLDALVDAGIDDLIALAVKQASA